MHNSRRVVFLFHAKCAENSISSTCFGWISSMKHCVNLVFQFIAWININIFANQPNVTTEGERTHTHSLTHRKKLIRHKVSTLKTETSVQNNIELFYFGFCFQWKWDSICNFLPQLFGLSFSLVAFFLSASFYPSYSNRFVRLSIPHVAFRHFCDCHSSQFSFNFFSPTCRQSRSLSNRSNLTFGVISFWTRSNCFKPFGYCFRFFIPSLSSCSFCLCVCVCVFLFCALWPFAFIFYIAHNSQILLLWRCWEFYFSIPDLLCDLPTRFPRPQTNENKKKTSLFCCCSLASVRSN